MTDNTHKVVDDVISRITCGVPYAKGDKSIINFALSHLKMCMHSLSDSVGEERSDPSEKILKEFMEGME